MWATVVLVEVLALAGLSVAAGRLGGPARRRRHARALAAFVREQIADGRRARDDAAALTALRWCDLVIGDPAHQVTISD